MGFPKFVFKRGTGVAVNDSGLFTAESALVGSEEELKELEGSWCDSPAEAAAGPAKKESVMLSGLAEEAAPKHVKKVK